MCPEILRFAQDDSEIQDDGEISKGAEADVAEGHFVAVILQQDVSLEFGSPSRDVLEFALGFCGIQSLALELVFQDFFSVQPVFYVFAPEQDAAGIELAGGLERL